MKCKYLIIMSNETSLLYEKEDIKKFMESDLFEDSHSYVLDDNELIENYKDLIEDYAWSNILYADTYEVVPSVVLDELFNE